MPHKSIASAPRTYDIRVKRKDGKRLSARTSVSPPHLRPLLPHKHRSVARPRHRVPAPEPGKPYRPGARPPAQPRLPRLPPQPVSQTPARTAPDPHGSFELPPPSGTTPKPKETIAEPVPPATPLRARSDAPH